MAHALQHATSQPQVSWPQKLSHSPTLRIGEVRSALSAEFPLLTVSKIRHYESIGLVEPQRTPSNQRLFSAADVERLRFILVEQRDRFLPLSQIGELLRQLDSGESPDDVHPGRMRVIVTRRSAAHSLEPGSSLWRSPTSLEFRFQRSKR